MILSILLFWVAFFLIMKFAVKAKTVTFHFCLAGRIYWRFTATSTAVGVNDLVNLVCFGPVSFQYITTPKKEKK